MRTFSPFTFWEGQTIWNLTETFFSNSARVKLFLAKRAQPRVPRCSPNRLHTTANLPDELGQLPDSTAPFVDGKPRTVVLVRKLSARTRSTDSRALYYKYFLFFTRVSQKTFVKIIAVWFGNTFFYVTFKARSTEA